MALFVKDTFLKVIGYILLGFGLFFMVLGSAMYIASDKPDEIEAGIGLAVFSTVMTVPGILIVRKGKKAKIEEDRIKAVANVIKSYRRITLKEVAEKLGIQRHEAAEYLSVALSKKMLKGYIDRTTDEFVTDGSRDKEVKAKFCSNCGAPVEEVFLQGDTVKCRSCGSIIS